MPVVAFLKSIDLCVRKKSLCHRPDMPLIYPYGNPDPRERIFLTIPRSRPLHMDSRMLSLSDVEPSLLYHGVCLHDGSTCLLMPTSQSCELLAETLSLIRGHELMRENLCLSTDLDRIRYDVLDCEVEVRQLRGW